MLDRPRMFEILPEGEIGRAKVDHFEVKTDFRGFRRDYVPPGKYARLCVSGQLYMTDTQMEWNTNWEVIHKAHSEVLIAGLGLGFIILPILAKPEVTRVTVVEKYADVIALVEPTIHEAAGLNGHKLVVVEGDALTWELPKGQTWDVIYFDIWPDICTDNLVEVSRLRRRFAKRLRRDNPKAWMGAWVEHRLRLRRRRERHSYYTR